MDFRHRKVYYEDIRSVFNCLIFIVMLSYIVHYENILTIVEKNAFWLKAQSIVIFEKYNMFFNNCCNTMYYFYPYNLFLADL